MIKIIKNRWKEILIIIFLFIIGAKFAFADNVYEKPEQKLAFSQLSQPKIICTNTLKARKDALLEKNIIKSANNPEILKYDKNKTLEINDSVYTYKKWKDERPKEIEYSLISIVGECENFYKTSSNTYILKGDLDKATTKAEAKNVQSDTAVVVLNDSNSDEYSNRVEANGNVSQENIILANKYWNMIPYNVRKRFVNEGWHIYVTDQNLAQTFYSGVYNMVAGVTIYEPKTIYIENRKSAINVSVIHEVGHAVDCMLGFVSSSGDFNNIYNSEVLGFVEVDADDPEHAKGSAIEYFAESFNQSILYPGSCSKNSPMTYNYIVNIINNF